MGYRTENFRSGGKGIGQTRHRINTITITGGVFAHIIEIAVALRVGFFSFVHTKPVITDAGHKGQIANQVKFIFHTHRTGEGCRFLKRQVLVVTLLMIIFFIMNRKS